MATTHRVQAEGGWPHPAAHPDAASSGFGEWLTQARQARGLTLDDISRETKIPLRNLEALEHGNLGVIPAFYERAEVRAVARVVGIDEQLAMGRLDTAMTPAGGSIGQGTADAQPGPRPRGVTAFLLLALGVLLGFGLGRAVLGWMSPSQRPGNAVATAESAAATPSAADAVAAPAGRDATVAPGDRQELLIPTSAQHIDRGEPPAPPETTAAASTASFTEIVVTTDPPGATVTVNGISWGVSPVTIRHLSPGAKRIRATKEGFAATEEVLPLADGQRRMLNLHLSGAELPDGGRPRP